MLLCLNYLTIEAVQVIHTMRDSFEIIAQEPGITVQMKKASAAPVKRSQQCRWQLMFFKSSAKPERSNQPPSHRSHRHRKKR